MNKGHARQGDASEAYKNVVFVPRFKRDGKWHVMDRINQYSFYDFGKTVGQMAEHTGDQVDSYDILLNLITIRSKFQALLEKGVPYSISISRNRADDVLSIVNTLYMDSTTITDASGDKTFAWPARSTNLIDGWRIKQLVSALDRFETVFAEEMREAAVYSIPKRGIFSTDLLLNDAVQSFPVAILGLLPEKTKNDWKAAGRCMALSLFSASGFHVARAVEGTIEAYYQAYSGKPGKTLHNWGDYIDHLEKIVATDPTPCPHAKTIAELKQMKDDYRNPIMHPRVELDEANAKVLLNNGESLIICMAQEISDLMGIGLQPGLLLGGLAPPSIEDVA